MGQVKSYSDETAAKIDAEIHAIISDAYRKTEAILNAHMPKLHEVAAYLMKHEKMSGEVFAQVMDGTYVEPAEEEPEDEEWSVSVPQTEEQDS